MVIDRSGEEGLGGDVDLSPKRAGGPGVVVSDGKGRGPRGESLRKAGENHEVTLHGDPHAGSGIWQTAVGHPPETDDGGEAVLKALTELGVDPLEEFMITFLISAEEGFGFELFEGKAAAHLVSHLAEVMKDDPSTMVPADLVPPLERGAEPMTLDDTLDPRLFGL